MKHILSPYDTVFWQIDRNDVVPCHKNMQVDVAIVGGGMAGLSAAQEALAHGKKVALFEQYYCGSGATGKSSGFVTPNAELSFMDFSKRYNQQKAHDIWNLISRGVSDIRENIKKYNFACDYVQEDTLVVATHMHDLKKLQEEGAALEKIGYRTDVYDRDSVKKLLDTTLFFGGVLYKDTFGMNPFTYCQELKRELQKQGCLIFEETPVLQIDGHTVVTAQAKIEAEHIVVCVDRFLPQLGMLSQDVYHAQTFVMASAPLSEKQIRQIFPEKSYMVWDTELIYNYFRLTKDNRLLLGGGDLFTTYLEEKHNYRRIVAKLTSYLEKTFPNNGIYFEYMWPGLIGLSKDIGPIAGRDKDHKHMYYVTAATGLPIAATLGRYAIEHLFDNRTDFDVVFDPYRKFPVGGFVQKIIGTKMSFALCNVIKQNIP